MIGRDLLRPLLFGLALLVASRAGGTDQSPADADDEEHLPAAAELLLRDGERVDWYEVRRTPEVCGKVERAKCIELLRKLLRRELSAPTLRLPEGLPCKDPARSRCAVVLDGCVPVAGLLAWELLKVAPPAVEATEEMFTAIHRNPSLTPIAILGLARFKNVAALPYETALLDSPDVLCRWEGFHGLEALGDGARPAVPKLIQLLERGDWKDRQDAARTLAAIGDAAAVEPLRRTLQLPPLSAQVAAADALIAFGSRASGAVPDLTALAHFHWSPTVRQHAAAAASALSGQHVEAPQTACRLEFQQLGHAWVGRAAGQEFSIPFVDRLSPRAPAGACVGVTSDQSTSILEPLGETCIVGSDHGEWGGSLVAVQGGGRTPLRETWYLHPLKLLRVRDDILVLEGMQHMGSAGGIARLARSADGAWSARPVLELPGAPLAAKVETDRSLLVLTGEYSLNTEPSCPKAPGVSALLRIGPGDRVENISGP